MPVLWLEESKKLEFVSREKKPLYQKHIGCWRSCGIALLKVVSEKGGKKGEIGSPSLKAEDRPAQAESPDTLGGFASPSHVY